MSDETMTSAAQTSEQFAVGTNGYVQVPLTCGHAVNVHPMSPLFDFLEDEYCVTCDAVRPITDEFKARVQAFDSAAGERVASVEASTRKIAEAAAADAGLVAITAAEAHELDLLRLRDARATAMIDRLDETIREIDDDIEKIMRQLLNKRTQRQQLAYVRDGHSDG